MMLARVFHHGGHGLFQKEKEMTTTREGNATYHRLDKPWTEMDEQEKEQVLKFCVDELPIVKHGPGKLIRDEIRKFVSTIAEYNALSPSAPFMVMDLLVRYHSRLPEDYRADNKAFDLLLNLYCQSMFMIGKALREKDQTIESLKSALKFKKAEQA